MDETETIQEEIIEAPAEASEDVVQESQIEDTAEVASLDVPESWGNDLKEYINGIEDQGARQAHYDKFKNFNDGYQKKFDSLANDRKDYEAQKAELDTSNQFYGGYKALEGAVDEKYRGGIVGHYGSMPNYFKWLHEQDVSISENPVEYALRLLEGQGYNQDNLAEAFSKDSYKNYKSQNDMGQFKEQLTQETQTMMQNWQEQQKLDLFTGAKDATGNLLHPNFEAVRNAMGSLQQAYPQASYEQLYDMACKADPTVSEGYIGSQVTQEAQKIVQKKDVAKAKSVVGIKSSPDSVGKKENQGWEAGLDEMLDAQG